MKYFCYSWCFLGSKTTCKTVSGPKPSQKCIFPFQYGDVTYNSCTRIGNDNKDDKAWCSVKVDSAGEFVKKNNVKRQPEYKDLILF